MWIKFKSIQDIYINLHFSSFRSERVIPPFFQFIYFSFRKQQHNKYYVAASLKLSRGK